MLEAENYQPHRPQVVKEAEVNKSRLIHCRSQEYSSSELEDSAVAPTAFNLRSEVSASHRASHLAKVRAAAASGGDFQVQPRPPVRLQIGRYHGAVYLDPPERALLLCVDEKSQIQALNRTQPALLIVARAAHPHDP